MNRILLVDDHPLYCSGISALLELHFQDATIYQANGINDAHALLATLDAIEWAFLDYFLPDGNGIELLRVLVKSAPKARFVLTSGNVRVELVHEALDLGAHGFLPKSGAPSDVLKCLQTIEAGDIYLDVDMQAQLKHFRCNVHEGRKRIVKQVSKRQKEVLLLLSAGYSNAEIASALQISPHTVKDHVSNIMQLLDADNRVHCITEARELGLIS